MKLRFFAIAIFSLFIFIFSGNITGKINNSCFLSEFISLYGCRPSVTFTAYGGEITKIIAKVNNQIITSQDLDDYCKVFIYQHLKGENDTSCSKKEFKKELLGRLIEDKLILGKAIEEKMNIPDALVSNKLKQIIFSYPSRKKFEESLQKKGLSVTLLKERIKEQYLTRGIIEKYVKSFVNVSPREISHYYNNNQDEFRLFPKYIFYIAKSEDNNILKEISQLIEERGVSLAVETYKDTLIEVESDKDELREEVSDILEKLNEGEYEIKKLDNIPHLIYLREAVSSERAVLLLSDVKEKIYSYLSEKKFKKKFDEWVKELKGKAVIENYYE